MRSDRLGMLDRKTKAITEYRLPLQSAPFKILYDGPQKALVSTVFATRFCDSIWRAGHHRGVSRAERGRMGGLDRDADDCFWFSEQFANKIARLCIDGVARAGRRAGERIASSAER
jgi:hypothetical protein